MKAGTTDSLTMYLCTSRVPVFDGCIMEPTTAVVRGGKRSLRARITAREALSNVISRPEVSVCMSVRDAVL